MKNSSAKQLKPQVENKPAAEAQISFKDMTIGQFDRLTSLLAQTSYKDKPVLTTSSTLNVKELEEMLTALVELPYRDVVDIINVIGPSANRQVQEFNSKDGLKKV